MGGVAQQRWHFSFSLCIRYLKRRKVCWLFLKLSWQVGQNWPKAVANGSGGGGEGVRWLRRGVGAWQHYTFNIWLAGMWSRHMATACQWQIPNVSCAFECVNECLKVWVCLYVCVRHLLAACIACGIRSGCCTAIVVGMIEFCDHFVCLTSALARLSHLKLSIGYLCMQRCIWVSKLRGRQSEMPSVLHVNWDGERKLINYRYKYIFG